LFEQAPDGFSEASWFVFELLPGAAGHAPTGKLELLLSAAIQLKSRVSVVVATAVRLDYQACVAPKEVGLEPATADIEAGVDLG
jgi:hypothetical protein